MSGHTSSSIDDLEGCLAGTNPLPPGFMTSAERLNEVARLLALGYLRLRARRTEQKANGPDHLRGFGLDFGGEGSVGDTDAHADRERP